MSESSGPASNGSGVEADTLRAVLDAMLTDEPLTTTLELLARQVEATVPGALCSVLVLDDDGVTLRPGAGPSLPAGYLDNFDGAVIGPDVGSCGSAVHRREPVIVTDIGSDPLWQPYRHLAEPHGLRACWSVPMLAARRPLGVLACYFRARGRPTPEQLATVQEYARLGTLVVERSRAHTELELSERVVAQLAEAAGDWVWRLRLRPGLVLESANAPMLAGSGLSYEELVQDPHLLERHLDEDTAAALCAARAGATVDWPRAACWTRPDGEQRWLSVREFATFDAAGHHVGWDGVAVDVTARKRSAERLRGQLEAERRASEHVQRLADVRATVVDAVSHQVRTPLTVLRGMSETLLRHDAQLEVAERRELTARLVARIENLESLLGDLLDLRRIEAGVQTGRVGRRRIDVGMRLRSLGLRAGLQGHRIHGPDATVYVEVPVEPLESAARRVFDNIVSHTPPTSQVWIDCSVEDGGRWLSVTVEDDGPGIERGRRELLHHAFGTLEAHDPRPRPGLGLPLAAAALAVCGGRLDIDEGRYGGTSVTLSLPLQEIDPQPRLL